MSPARDFSPPPVCPCVGTGRAEHHCTTVRCLRAAESVVLIPAVGLPSRPAAAARSEPPDHHDAAVRAYSRTGPFGKDRRTCKERCSVWPRVAAAVHGNPADRARRLTSHRTAEQPTPARRNQHCWTRQIDVLPACGEAACGGLSLAADQSSAQSLFQICKFTETEHSATQSSQSLLSPFLGSIRFR